MSVRALMTACLISAASIPAAAATLTGTVYTERPVKAAIVQVWARGDALLADPRLALAPLVESRVAAGKPFSVEIGELAPPLRVEVSAEGHLGAALRLDIPEQLALRPLWLPAGRPLRVVVDSPADGLLLRGDVIPEGGNGTTPELWQPVVASRPVEAGETVVSVPRDGAVRLTLQDASGRWGDAFARLPASSLHVGLTSVQVRLATLLSPDVYGMNVAVADVGAPVGCAVRSGPDGIAVVQIVPRSRWRVIAVAGTRAAVLDGRGSPPEESEVTLERAPVGAQWEKDRRLVFEPWWLPAAVSGDAGFVSDTGLFLLPFVAPGGWLTVWAPGTALTRARITRVGTLIGGSRAGAVDVSGAVVDLEGKPLAGVPVWRWRTSVEISAGGELLQHYDHAPIPDAVTDDHGRFAIPNMFAGAHLLSARAAGRPEGWWGPAELSPSRSSVVIRVGRGAALRLRAVDERGEPLPGLDVGMVLEPEAPHVQRTGALPAQARATRTGPDGTVELAGLDAGKASMRITGSGRVARVLEVEIPAAGLDLGDVVVEPGIAVEGVVVGPEGDPVPGAEVLVGAGDEAKPAGRCDETGRFVLPGQPRSGQILLTARTDDLLPAHPVPVELPPTTDVRVPVRPAGVLAVKVVRAGSGTSLASAVASLFQRWPWHRAGARWRSEPADADGRARFSRLEPGRYDLTVHGEGLVPVERQVTVESGSNPELEVTLEPGLALHGRVVDADGAGVGDATVRAWGGPGGSLAAAPSVQTERDGRFVLDGLAPGKWSVQAVRPDGERARETVEVGEGAEVELRLGGVGALRVRVVDSERRPVPGARVVVTARPGHESATDAEGVVVVDRLPAGRTEVAARAKGHVFAMRDVTIEAGTTAEVEVTVEQGGTVTGVVRGLSPTELDGCTLWAGGVEGRPGPDGRFTLDGVRPPRVVVEARTGGRHRATLVEVRTGETAGPVELDFGGEPVRGIVRRAGSPVAGAGVTLIAADSSEDAVTDKLGLFFVSSFPDTDAVHLGLRDADGTELFSTTVALPSSRFIEIDLPAATLVGAVVRSDTGAALGGARIVATPEGGSQRSRETASGGNGAFVVDGASPGLWTVRASMAGFRPAEARVTVGAAGTARVELRLEPADDELTLRIRHADGSPCRDEGVTVTAEDAAGRRFGGWVRCGPDGVATVTGAVPGAFGVIVASHEEAAVVATTIPGPPVDVTLGPAASVYVVVPDRGWDVVAVAPGTGLRWHQTNRIFMDPPPKGISYGCTLPLGTWQVVATGPAGEAATRSVTLSSPGAVRLDLP